MARKLIVMLAVALWLPSTGYASAILINGSFESGPSGGGFDLDVLAGSTDITGWTVFGAAPLGNGVIDFLNARIFKPLAITAYDQDLAVGPNFPQGYGRHALGPVRPEPPAAAGWLYAAGELAMSARDLAKWDIARINRTLLKPADWAVLVFAAVNCVAPPGLPNFAMWQPALHDTRIFRSTLPNFPASAEG